jgi:hypothetical protein
MKKQPLYKYSKYVVCVRTDAPDLITPRMIYQVLKDESAEKSGYIRVIDNEGEDYLYPELFFIPLELSDHIESVLFCRSNMAIA